MANLDGAKTNLIINYLPQTLSDEDFRSMFLSIGPIKSCKIIRDKNTLYSYGFGFVDYQSPGDAARAITTLNGLSMENKRIKVAYARPNDENSKGANLYVCNLPKHYREEELMDQFQKYGSIVQTRVLVNQVTGQSKGVGFVLFHKKCDAESAMADMDGKTPPGGDQPFSIKFADDNAKKVRPPPGSQNFQHPAYSQGPRFPYSGGMGNHGPMRNPGNRFRYNPMGGGAGNFGNNYGNYNNGYGSGMGGSGMMGQQNQGHILFVYNIGYDADEKTLWQLFAPLGTVQKVNVIMDHAKSQCKGYGFVTMTNYDEAQHAIDCLNGYVFNGKQLSVSFKS
ncbi:hypothetical protein FSP39_007329 [Pinctada imbricata]|uniref:RRM domain-containing protein n=1 Tax=Pinctada imbricata TaxID=66713 RepID=A0AA88XLG7_PINIB|nr:hypothetical protein FSP39_007329 [Pinctada imbricata]